MFIWLFFVAPLLQILQAPTLYSHLNANIAINTLNILYVRLWAVFLCNLSSILCLDLDPSAGVETKLMVVGPQDSGESKR